MYILDTRTYWGHYGTEIKFLKTDIRQWIELERVHEKNGVIHLIMFTARVLVINGSFYVLSAGYSKKSVPVWAIHLYASARSYLTLWENTMDYVLLSYH